MNAIKIKQKLTEKYRSFEECTLELLKDPKEAIEYIDVAIEDYYETQDFDCFLLAIKDVVKAQSSMIKLSQKTRLGRQSLYKTLSQKGNPRLSTLFMILETIGLRLSVKTI